MLPLSKMNPSKIIPYPLPLIWDLESDHEQGSLFFARRMRHLNNKFR